MKKRRDSFAVLGGGGYANLFYQYGNVTVMNDGLYGNDGSIMDWDRVRAVVFTGGADVNPALYGEPTNRRTYCTPKRDENEALIYRRAKREGIPCIGICRGAQFLTVMNGGKLVQDITGHALSGTHPMITSDGEEIQVNSTHHQMMLPLNSDHTLLGWAHNLSEYYDRGFLDDDTEYELIVDKEGNNVEPEVVWYPNSQSLAVQYHPETMERDSQGVKFFHSLVEKYINV